ncbi:HlyD family efflux transporter periplasmic adaptor subunit [Allocoleopsis sp.]|uniref:HlyD family efflux transporter periplasmic adaptor subunit n=1 Tax=Allocoleopsis sp. TaxID=3088169 RepID=UPI002FD5D045
MNRHNGSNLDQNNQIALKSPSVPSQPHQVALTHTNGNGATSNGNGNGKSNGSRPNGQAEFDQPVILRQPHYWSRGIIWAIMGVTTFGVIWASVAKIEEAVPAQGKLEPQGKVQEIQAPVAGVVKELNVRDGQSVKKGDLLLRLDPTADKAKLASFNQIRTKLLQENQFYRSALRNPTSALTPPSQTQVELSSELPSLIKSRDALIAENQFYQSRIDDSPRSGNLGTEQRQRMQFATAELNSRIAAAESEVAQLKKRIDQNESQLANSKERLKTEQKILNDLEPLVRVGGFSRIQYTKQQSEVGTRQAEVQQLTDERLRLELDRAKAREQLENTKALTKKELTDLIASNNKQINDIDSKLDSLKRQLRETIVANDKKIAEIDSQLKQAEVTLNYQELRAPVSGTVFDLKPAATGFVTNSTEPILKIVPEDALIAKVDITNKDIGFVKEGMSVDVRIDSFPFSEFGDVKGELVGIGSDALPPDEIHRFYRFPAKIKLKQQFISLNDRKVPLQSGMSVSVNIRVRDRTVMSIFTDLFNSKTDSLKTVR